MPSFVRSSHIDLLSLAALASLAGCSHDAPGQHAVAAGPAVTVAVTAAAPAPAPTTSAAPSAIASASAAPVASPPSPPPSGPRLYSKARFAWIQAEPRHAKGWMGYLGLGSSVALRGGSVEAAKVRGSEGQGGCRAWYAIEPRGYVCDGDAATLDPSDPVVQAIARDAPKTESPWPYEYAESNGAPRYKRPPTEAEQRRAEFKLAEHLGLIAKARSAPEEPRPKSLTGVDLASATAGRWGAPATRDELMEVSPLVRVARKEVVLGSTVAYTREIEIDGRTYLVTHDLALVPKDRVKPYPHVEFQGVEIGKGVDLPLAFFRKMERPKHRRAADGTFEKTGESWPRLAWVGLTGDEVKEGKVTYLATREAGLWVLAEDACVVKKQDPPAQIARMKEGRRTWLDVSVLGGTMVAYEGDKPVFATLISPGRGGVPVKGIDPIETASTPTGTFRVDGKFVTATMVSSTNDDLVHTEVQFVQNFHGPHALHAAYWHDVWGEKKSGGCINLSPIDSQRIFWWTEPAVPKDWYGMRSLPELGPATVVRVHK